MIFSIPENKFKQVLNNLFKAGSKLPTQAFGIPHLNASLGPISIYGQPAEAPVWPFLRKRIKKSLLLLLQFPGISHQLPNIFDKSSGYSLKLNKFIRIMTEYLKLLLILLNQFHYFVSRGHSESRAMSPKTNGPPRKPHKRSEKEIDRSEKKYITPKNSRLLRKSLGHPENKTSVPENRRASPKITRSFRKPRGR